MSGERELPEPEEVAVDDDPRAAEPRYRFGAGDLVVAIVLGFFFAYSVYAAVGNLTAFPRLAVSLKAPVPWASLVAGVVLPVALFVGAVLLGRGRATFDRALILLAALAASCAAGLTLVFVGLSVVNIL